MGPSSREEMGLRSHRGRKGEYPGGMKTQERIGSSWRLTTAGRMYGFLIRLNPLKARSSCLRQGKEGPRPG
jgi:hypothetical protein